MFKKLAAGLLSCSAAMAFAASAQTPAPMDGPAAFLEAVQGRAMRMPRRDGAQMPECEEDVLAG